MARDPIEMPDFDGVDAGTLHRWRALFAKPEFLKRLEAVAKLAKERDEILSRLYVLGREFDDLALEAMNFEPPERGAMPSDITEGGYGYHWYEIPRDGKQKTAHEALARFCASAWKKSP